MNREFIENQIKVVLTHIRGYSISFIMMKGKLKNEMSFSTYYVGKYIVLKKRSITPMLLMREELNCTISVEDN